MPHKFNAARRHKFDKVQYRVINWAEYNESLRQRGDLTIWVSEEAQSVWSAPRRTSRGGQRRYSDLAIETCLMLRTAYHLGLDLVAWIIPKDVLSLVFFNAGG